MRCPHCRHCEAIVLPALQMLERRMSILEGGAALPERVAQASALEQQERDMLIEALTKANGVQSTAARRLGISARVFHYKVRKHGLKAYCRFAR